MIQPLNDHCPLSEQVLPVIVTLCATVASALSLVTELNVLIAPGRSKAMIVGVLAASIFCLLVPSRTIVNSVHSLSPTFLIGLPIPRTLGSIRQQSDIRPVPPSRALVCSERYTPSPIACGDTSVEHMTARPNGLPLRTSTFLTWLSLTVTHTSSQLSRPANPGTYPLSLPRINCFRVARRIAAVPPGE